MRKQISRLGGKRSVISLLKMWSVREIGRGGENRRKREKEGILSQLRAARQAKQAR